MEIDRIIVGPFRYTRELRQNLNKHFNRKIFINTRLRTFSKLVQTTSLSKLYEQVKLSILYPQPFIIPSNMKYLLFIKKIHKQNSIKFNLKQVAKLWQKQKQI